MMGGGGGPARYVGLLCGLRGGLVEYTVSGKRMAGTVSTEQMRASCDGRAWLLFVYLGVVNSAGCAAGVGWMESQVGETASRFPDGRALSLGPQIIAGAPAQLGIFRCECWTKVSPRDAVPEESEVSAPFCQDTKTPIARFVGLELQHCHQLTRFPRLEGASR
jgi:hypothetical protein